MNVFPPRLRLAAIAGAMLLALLPCLALRTIGQAANAAEPPKPKVTISKETTYITGPLRPDGYPDYVAALNQIASRGVTVENNAVVPLLHAFGPGEIAEEHRAEVFKLLGIAPLPVEGDYFVTQEKMIERWQERPENREQLSDDELDAQFTQAQERPWKTAEFPIVAEWLKMNEKPLVHIAAACEREKFYFPIVVGERPLLEAELPMVSSSRLAAQAILTQAMLDLERGANAAAWQKVRQILRLARAVSSDQWLVSSLVAYAIEGMSINAAAAMVHGGGMEVADLRPKLIEIQNLPPLSKIVDRFDIGERYIQCDAVCRMARGGLPEFRRLMVSIMEQADIEVSKHREWRDVEFARKCDWNQPLLMVNRWCDCMVQTTHVANAHQRRHAFADLEERLRSEMSPRRGLLWYVALNLFTKPSLAVVGGDLYGRLWVGIAFPGISAALQAQDRYTLRREMLEVSIALAIRRRELGTYPEQLDSLVPNYLPKIPGDPFSEDDSPIRYRREGTAYVLWSIHMNGVNDDAAEYEDTPQGDDYCLRPVPKVRATKKPDAAKD